LKYPERESNPHGRNGHRIFLPTTAFAATDEIIGICGLDYLFSVLVIS
jgi:hypothetical protein